MRFAHQLRPTLLVAAGAAACRPADLPEASSPAYAEAVAAFYRGVAAAQVGEGRLAAASFQRVTELAPGEPAGWADLGLIALQRRELVEAAEGLARARTLAPDHGRIHLLSALVERERGRPDTAIEYFRRAVELDPEYPPALLLLAQAIDQEDRPTSAAEARQVIDRLLAVRPGNLIGLLERARLAAKDRDVRTLRQTLEQIGTRADSLSVPLRAELRAVEAAGATGEFDRAATEVAFLQTALQPLPAFLSDQEAVVTSPGAEELLLTRFLRLPVPAARGAPPDTALELVPEGLALGATPVEWVRALWLSEEVPLALAAASADTVWISPDPDHAQPFAFPGGPSAGSVSPAAIAPLDYDYDFRMDLVLAGPGGLRLLRQDESGTFGDVTGEAIPRALARGAYAGAWAADLDLEGDMDLVLATLEGVPIALRNRGDGRFEPYSPFAGITRLREFVWADLDADGDPDAGLLDAAGQLHVFLNARSGPSQFARHPVPDTLGPVAAMAVADLNRDATLELILLRADGALSHLWLDAGRWRVDVLARSPDLAGAEVTSSGLLVADLDNNGDLDLVASTSQGTRAWLGAESGFRPLPPLDVRTTALADIGEDGRLDLIGTSPDGAPRLLVNRGTRDYYATSLRPQAAGVTGDRRINSFGIGGEIEIRAGLLYQKRPITGPVVQFGLGDHPQADVARIVWPNGTVQAEFNLPGVNETIVTRQRLKGSCPWVFTYDGGGMRFITDFLWRTALGLRINAQGKAAVIHSEDWIRIRGDQLAPRDGHYDVRITAELWETHFFDHVALMVVDHPEGTEVFVDERFTLPAPEPTVHLLEPLRPVAWARDQAGRDVTALIRARDERYLDTFDRGPYQGIAGEHYVEVALGDDVPADGPLWLVASGWVYPTDASINVAVSQGDHSPPRGLTLEVPDGKGGWATVEADLGFPAGKTKTMLIDLRPARRRAPGGRLRLRTNMEIYWDQIAWALGRPDDPIATRRLLPATAELRYRGFSAVTQASRAAPELPWYDTVAAAVPTWRDLLGFYTRYGDVRPLNAAIDDRYTIMNAGDELVLRFPVPPPPRDGWTRDFVLIGDGWVKDGDYNTGFSTTVLPLPYHGMSDYDRPPAGLRDDPAYRRHPEDWQVFHTRYVTPRSFHRALAPQRDP